LDVGSLDTVVMGRLRRTIGRYLAACGARPPPQRSSCAVLVASSAPLDQFIVRHPDYFFGHTPEHAFIQPDQS